MRAKAAGQALFTADQAENPSRGFSVFKLDGAIPSDRISFVTNNVAIGRNFVVNNDTFNFNEDTTNNNLTVLANDTITANSGAVLTIQSVGTTSNGGTVSITSDNQRLTYSPAANFNGQETFTYTVRDQTGVTSTGTVTVQVNPVNDSPVAVNDTVTTVRAGDTDVFVNVLANDNSGPDATETLVVTQVGTPSQGGTVRVATSGTGVVYTPRVGFTGNETFTYTISDGNGGTATATATMVVGPAVPPPTVVNDSFNVQEDAAAATFDPLANDTPAATGDTLTITSVQAPNGTATITTNSTRISYSPRANATGTELVVYTARSTNGGSAVGTITFNIAAVNDAPDAVNDSIDVLSQPNQSVDVLANDLNVDTGETLVITAVTQPPTGQGTVQIGPNGRTLIYSAPTTEFTGTVTFAYTVGDGSTLSDTANVTLNVQNFRPRNVGIVLDSPVQGVDVSAMYSTSVGGNGTPTQQTVVRTTNGVQVNNVGPGEVRFEIPKLPFLVGDARTVVVQSAFNDTDSLTTPVQIGNRHAKYVDIRDFMGQNLRSGVTAAVVPNQSAQWFDSQGAWRDYSNVSVALNSAGTQLTVRGTSPTNQQREAILPLTDSRVQVRAKDGNASLVRIRATPDQAFAASTSATNTASGEGESAPSLNAQAVDQAMQQIRTDASAVPVDDIDTIARDSVSTGYRRGFRTR
jgi:hypothetical protein